MQIIEEDRSCLSNDWWGVDEKATELGNWTKWSECSEGFRSRKRCSPEGDGCHYEDVECDREVHMNNGGFAWGGDLV